MTFTPKAGRARAAKVAHFLLTLSYEIYSDSSYPCSYLNYNDEEDESETNKLAIY